MKPEGSGIQRRVEELRNAYIKGLPGRMRAIEDCWQQVCEVPVGESAQSWQQLHRLAHNLAGSAATFGFHRLGDIARDFELEIQRLLDRDSADIAAIGMRLAALDAAVGEATASSSLGVAGGNPAPTPDTEPGT